MHANGEKHGVPIHKSFIIKTKNMAKKRPMYETFQA
jgi:hypothetical protein